MSDFARDVPLYGSTRKRAPKHAPVRLAHTITEMTGPRFLPSLFPAIADLSTVDGRRAQGERINVRGRVLDEQGRPVPHTLIEIWQANASGRYHHDRDQHDAPLDPHFTGAGRFFTDAEGWYQYASIKPGATPGATIRTPGGRPTSITREFFLISLITSSRA